MGSTRTVVFVCQHGAAKSILAAAVLERLAAEQGAPIRALARGTEPEPRVARAVAAGLLAKGVDVRAWQPRQVTRDDLARAWRIISFEPDLAHLLPHGALVERWNDVSAVAEGFEVAESTIAERLRELVNDIARSGPAITPPRAT
jgi:protein-tyrosine-phosphatase